MASCPCCSDPLLRHARLGGSYYFCQYCRLEMPEIVALKVGLNQPAVEVGIGQVGPSRSIANAALSLAQSQS